jgi:hypothetical protein
MKVLILNFLFLSFCISNSIAQCPEDVNISFGIVDDTSCSYDFTIEMTATQDYNSVDIEYYVVCGDLIYIFDDKLENLSSGNTYQSRFYDASTDCGCELSAMLTLNYMDDNNVQQEMDCGFYEWVTLQNITVPAELADVSISKEREKTYFNWTTLMELNVDNFVIEYAADGRSFQGIQETYANNKASNYQVELEDLTGYYRLKTVDVDGSFTYSDILFHKATTNYTLSRNIINLEQSTDILVYDSMGRILYDNATAMLNLNELNYEGIKFVKIDQEILKVF